MPNEKDKLDRIFDELTQEILSSSAEDIRESFSANGEDPDEIAKRNHAALSSVIAKARRRRLDAARKAFDQEARMRSQLTVPGSSEERRRRLASLLSKPSVPRTLAARSATGEEMSDDEVSSLLDNLVELGITDEE
jgi:hypothetical protein